jgi:hypothetical protein
MRNLGNQGGNPFESRRHLFFVCCQRWQICALLLLLCTAARSVPALAQLAPLPAPVQPAAPVAAAVPVPFDADPRINQLITRLVLQEMPHRYERNKGWGAQAERWDGIQWEQDGWEIKTHRRKKMVNHGTWRKYSASLADPETQFDVSVTNIHQTASQRLGLQVNFSTRLNLFARQSEWVKGVQLYSLSAEGKARIRMTLEMEMGIALDPARFPPDVVFRPHVTAADLTVDEFRIDRVSKLGGEFAIQVTQLARKELDEEIRKKQSELVDRINREIERNSDDLRLSLPDARKSKWADAAEPFLPAGILEAAPPATGNK